MLPGNGARCVKRGIKGAKAVRQSDAPLLRALPVSGLRARDRRVPRQQAVQTRLRHLLLEEVLRKGEGAVLQEARAEARRLADRE